MAVTTNSEADILSRIIVPETPGLTSGAAQFFLSLSFDPDDLTRMNELSHKAREGTLTDGEQDALNNYERVGHLLAILKSKARVSLKAAADDLTES